MSEQDNLRIARQAFDAWNAHDPERYVKNLDEKWRAESDTLPAPLSGRAAARDFLKLYVTAFPDLHFNIDQMLASGDFVVTALDGDRDPSRSSDEHPADKSKERHTWVQHYGAQERQADPRLDLLGRGEHAAAARCHARTTISEPG